MAGLPTGMLTAVKSYLGITWQDDDTDERITGYIKRGMARLQQIAGAPLDFIEEDQPRALLLDYCRYANSQALEVFEKNFGAELLNLHLNTQAPLIDSLVVWVTAASGSDVSVKASPVPARGNGYVYQTGTELTLPARLQVCTPGDNWTLWDGYSTIPAVPGQELLIAEINADYLAERAGKVTV